MKEKMRIFYKNINSKFNEQFGFQIEQFTFSNLTDYMYRNKDASSLAVTRILFGLAMLFDIPDERGGAIMDKIWGDRRTCHFPLIPFVQAIPMPYMALIYGAMWFGALGITLGYKYKISSIIFTVCYWYLLLIEKSYWNNHSYLFGLIGLLLVCTEANCYWSIDTILHPSIFKETVPYWNYFVLKYQFFIVYFMAGLKKGTAEWLDGYSVQYLSEHWVFAPFKLFLTVHQTDYLIVHCFIFVFDLTIAIWMMWTRSRHIAMVFCALFNLMNSRLFSIGMFPWVCLATMPLFYPFDWPKTTIRYFEVHFPICAIIRKCNHTTRLLICNNFKNNDTKDKSIDIIEEIKGDVKADNVKDSKVERKVQKLKHEKPESHNENKKDEYSSTKVGGKRLTMYLIIFYVLTQASMPFSHFITKGYNNWADGLYGYSWDMMVHTWDVHSIVVKVIDNENHSEFYVDPNVYTPNDRWTKHGDMVYQYVKCLNENLFNEANRNKAISPNISIYVDIWCAMNSRFAQRMFDPKVDLLNVTWSPFSRVSYLMPLLDEASSWRTKLDEIKEEVRTSDNEVMFLADFPGYEYEKYIPIELHNVTLTILDGNVVYEPEITNNIGQSYQLTAGNRIKVDSGFHKVLNIGHGPAYYMYTYYNSTEIKEKKEIPKLPIFNELLRRFNNMFRFGSLVMKSFHQIFFSASSCQD